MKTPWIALILKLVKEVFGSPDCRTCLPTGRPTGRTDRNGYRRMNTAVNIMNRIAKPMFLVFLVFFVFLFNCAHITSQVSAKRPTIPAQSATITVEYTDLLLG